MDPVVGEVIKYSIAPAVGLMTLLISNGHNRSLANAERTHQEIRAEAEARETRRERRYEERRAAFADLIEAATTMRETALKAEWKGEPPPSDYLDPPDLVDYLQPLRNARNDVLLIGTKESRDAADKLQTATEDYVWSWTSEDYRKMDQALIDFRDAARHDLGIEGGAPDTPVAKPTRKQRPVIQKPPA